jgi:hypothetical protein
MVEKALREALNRIFQFPDITYNAPAEETPEQDKLFLKIDKPNASIKDGVEIYRIEGQAFIYTLRDRYNLGYIPKRIRHADLADTNKFYFYEIEENLPVYQNLVRRSFSFVYFFSGDYDPNNGTITSIDYTLTTEGDN